MRKSGLASLAIFYYDFREDEKGTSEGYSHQSYFSFATSLIRITIFLPLSIRHTVVVPKALAMTNSIGV